MMLLKVTYYLESQWMGWMKQKPNLIRSKLSSKNTMNSRKKLGCIVSKDGLNSGGNGQAIPMMPKSES